MEQPHPKKYTSSILYIRYKDAAGEHAGSTLPNLFDERRDKKLEVEALDKAGNLAVRLVFYNVMEPLGCFNFPGNVNFNNSQSPKKII
jgi:hypothetical protein